MNYYGVDRSTPVEFKNGGLEVRLHFASCLLLFAVLAMLAQPAFAETPEEVLGKLKSSASATPGFQGFSAARGETFYKNKHGGDWSCSSCHTDKPIKPLAPSANPERFTDMKKIEKWFKRNCNDMLDRVCTPQEKGDFLAYLLTIHK